MSLTTQVETFLLTVIIGMFLACVFDGYRVLRGSLKPRPWVTWLGDLAYWIFATIVVFFGLMVGNWGELRLYVFLGLISGAGIYYRFFSRYTLRLYLNLLRLITTVYHGLCWVLKFTVLKPFKLILTGLIRPCQYLWHTAISRRKPPPAGE